uniref:EOG090X0ILG n=1 Tax=Alona affinis TaxID=381656 RepID=A0A9N6WX36_9CRUS|nr:EOG090X0ILG [Alona affinis]
MSGNDWQPVIITKKVTGTSAKSDKVINQARRQGVAVETVSKYGAASNKHPTTTLNTAKLDQESEELKHASLSLDVSKLIMKGRQDKGLTQKELATKINEKPQVITDYEAGRGIPNQQILGKIERALGMKLRGKDKGKPLDPPPSKAAATGKK